MAVPLEQFVKQLEDSGVLGADTLKGFIPPKASPKDAEELARELVRKKKLTKFQVEEVYRGKGKSLVLGNYVLIERIGAGGMGQVFKAEHRRLKRVVAVKLLPAAMTSDKAAIARFEREVEAAAKLRHPNIVAADDADQANGVHFLVMELVDGSDLSALVKKDGPLPVEKAVNYILQAAKGLEAAHAVGIVHRDIKPANLLLDKKGTVKILDMGLARLSAAADAPTAAELTSSGAVMGTVDYIAPEQALSTKTADARADIYSLGCSLHFLLTGKATYDGDTLMAKLLAHREQPIPSLRTARPEVPEQLEVVFKKMLAKKVEARYQTMTEVVAALEAVASREPASTVNSEEATAWVPSAEERKKLSKAGASKPLGPLVQVVASEKSKHLFAKFAGGAFATIIAPILVTFLIKYLERDDSPPNPPKTAIDASSPEAEETKNYERPLPAIAPFDAKQALAHQEAWAKHLGVKVEIENSLGMKLRLIPPGEFTMGSTPAEIEEALKFTGEDKHWQENIKSEAPQHKVILTQPLYLGTHEVTQAEYEKVMEKNPSHFAPMGAGKDAVAEMDTTTHPVEQVSWNDAAEFCVKLSEKEKLKPFYFRSGETVTMLAGTGYRLASETEWEFACRGGTTTKYWIGDQDEDLPQAAWFGTNFGGRTHQVGELKANPFGLYDIHGNVFEWVQDGWEPPYYRQFQDHPALNPSGPSSAGSRRVLRGGDCYAPASNCRASSRFASDPTYRAPNVGFRVSLPVDAVKSALSKQPGNVNTGRNDWPADAPKPAIAPFDANQALAHQEAWAKHLGTKVEIENSLGMKLRLIPPGEFTMGSPQAEIDALVQSITQEWRQVLFRSEGPRHPVKLTQAFYLASCEVTQRQYQEVMGVNPSHFSPTGDGKEAVKDLDTSQFPVEMVSWFDAIDFCIKLSEKEKCAPYYLHEGENVTVLGGTGYRLPTEAEWECACRAGTTTRWSFGDNETNLAQHAWFGFNSGGRTQQVGELPANPFGLYDVYGNVWEWCWDWHGGDYGKSVDGAVDPDGAKTGSNRVYRGGGWHFDAAHCRSAIRYQTQPTLRAFNHGFRVARTIDTKSEALPAAGTGVSAARPNPTNPEAISVNSPPAAIAPFDANQALTHQETWAKHLGTKVEIENSLGMKLRLIPPGEFMMGSPQEEINTLVENTTDPNWQDIFRGEGPPHRVQITKAFFLASCEVTQQQYQKLIGVNPSHFSPTGPGKEFVKDLDTGQHPVESVSWFDAVDFCNKLSEREQRLPYYAHEGEAVKILGGTGYRLPTEAEWEYAYRAGTTTRWSYGDDEHDLGQHAWFVANSNGGTHRVGQLRANPFGMFDMQGNAWEWCWDWCGEYTAGVASDPTGPDAGPGRVLRGGGFSLNAAACRSASRLWDDPVSRYNIFDGFRVCCGR